MMIRYRSMKISTPEFQGLPADRAVPGPLRRPCSTEAIAVGGNLRGQRANVHPLTETSVDRSSRSNQREDTMRNFRTIAVLAPGLAMAGTRYAPSSSSSGTVGAHVGDSMKQPMAVTTRNGNGHMQPN